MLLSNLSNECVEFTIYSCHYPDIRRCVVMDIKSLWISTDEKKMLIDKALRLVEETVDMSIEFCGFVYLHPYPHLWVSYR